MTTSDKASSRDQSAPARDYLARDTAIVEALRTAGRSLSLQEVGDAIGETKDRGELCRPILKRLVAAGIIAESETRPRLFTLAPTANAVVVDPAKGRIDPVTREWARRLAKAMRRDPDRDVNFSLHESKRQLRTVLDFAAASSLDPADSGSGDCLTADEQLDQATRCSCRGTDDLCPCQNAPDPHTRDRRAAGGAA